MRFWQDRREALENRLSGNGVESREPREAAKSHRIKWIGQFGYNTACCPIDSRKPIRWKCSSLQRGKPDAGSFPRAGPLKDQSRQSPPRAKPMKKRLSGALSAQ